MSEACEVRHEALSERVDRIEKRIDGIDTQVRTQGESISALRAQVAMWAAFGALLGGGIVSLAASIISKAT